jgi:hypothetical protein
MPPLFVIDLDQGMSVRVICGHPAKRWLTSAKGQEQTFSPALPQVRSAPKADTRSSRGRIGYGLEPKVQSHFPESTRTVIWASRLSKNDHAVCGPALFPREQPTVTGWAMNAQHRHCQRKHFAAQLRNSVKPEKFAER